MQCPRTCPSSREQRGLRAGPVGGPRAPQSPARLPPTPTQGLAQPVGTVSSEPAQRGLGPQPQGHCAHCPLAPWLIESSAAPRPETDPTRGSHAREEQAPLTRGTMATTSSSLKREAPPGSAPGLRWRPGLSTQDWVSLLDWAPHGLQDTCRTPGDRTKSRALPRSEERFLLSSRPPKAHVSSAGAH